jgi:hypothetical protein
MEKRCLARGIGFNHKIGCEQIIVKGQNEKKIKGKAKEGVAS